MTKNNFIAILVSVGLIAANTQPFIALAQTATPNSGVAVFSEDFNDTDDTAVPTGWNAEGDWGVVFGGDEFGKVLYGDWANIVYHEQAGARIVTPTIDLAGASNARISFLTRCDTEYTPGTDYMKLQMSNDGATFTDLMSWNEATIDTDSDPTDRAMKTFSDVEVPSEFLTSNARLAFLWTANATDNDYDGCIIDDLVVTTNASGDTGGDDDGTGTTTDDTGGDGDGTGTTTDNTGGDDDGTGTTTDNTGGDNDGTGTTTDNTGGTATTTPGSGNNGGNNTTVRELDECDILANEGVTYKLTRNIEADAGCFRITANNITLDGAGFEVFGDRESGDYGVKTENVSGITIKNISLRNLDFGAWLVSTDNSTVESARFDGNSYGFVLHEGSGIEVKNSRAEHNMNAGIYLKDATNSIVSGITAVDNAVGINLDSSENNIVRNNLTESNDRGILLLGSHNNEVTLNTSSNNNFGLVVESVSMQNTISNTRLLNNVEGLAIGSGDNTFSGLSIEGSVLKGIRFFEADSTGNEIVNTTIVHTTNDGFDVTFDPAGTNSSAAGITGTVFTNTPIARYSIVSPGGTFTYGNSFGSVAFTAPVSGTGMNMADEIKIENGKITIGPAFNAAANITFATSSTLINTSVLKDGVSCATCVAGSNALTFAVTGSGVYELQGTVSTSTDDTDDDGTGTTTDNTGGDDDGTGTTTDNTGGTDDADDDNDNGSSNNNDDDDDDGPSSSIQRRSGGIQVVTLPTDVSAVIAILDSPTVNASVDNGTTVVSQGTGGPVFNAEFDTGSSVSVDDENTTQIVDDEFTGTGGPEDLVDDFGTTSETAAIADAFDDENPNKWRNIGIGALILIIVIAIIFGISRGV